MSYQVPLLNSTPSTASPHNFSTPLIPSSQPQDLQNVETSTGAYTDEKGRKSAVKKLLNIGKKKENPTMDARIEAGESPEVGIEAKAMSASSRQQQSGAKKSPPAPLSPSRMAHLPTAATSPSRLRSGSPRLLGPGNSEIFERNVQEPLSISNLHSDMSPAHIPAHVITEDSIPPALEASAQAITSSSLDPDEVEIVTSSSHQPAASGIEGSASHGDMSYSPPLIHRNKSDETTSSFLQYSGSLPGFEDDGASSYGHLDPNDFRRLSFISFQDIVQSEQQHQYQMADSALGEAGSRESLHIHDRAGSPFRAPRSPTTASINGLTTSPTGININPIAGTSEQSPPRSIKLGSPSSQHGDLNIETMRQALRKTASGDLSGGRGSAGMSPVSDAASFRDVPRTNT